MTLCAENIKLNFIFCRHTHTHTVCARCPPLCVWLRWFLLVIWFVLSAVFLASLISFARFFVAFFRAAPASSNLHLMPYIFKMLKIISLVFTMCHARTTLNHVHIMHLWSLKRTVVHRPWICLQHTHTHTVPSTTVSMHGTLAQQICLFARALVPTCMCVCCNRQPFRWTMSVRASERALSERISGTCSQWRCELLFRERTKTAQRRRKPSENRQDDTKR